MLEQYVARSDARGRLEGQPYPRSQQAIREISGLVALVKNVPSPASPYSRIYRERTRSQGVGALGFPPKADQVSGVKALGVGFQVSGKTDRESET